MCYKIKQKSILSYNFLTRSIIHAPYLFPDAPPTNIAVVLVLGVATRIMMMVDTAMVTGYPYGICGIFGE